MCVVVPLVAVMTAIPPQSSGVNRKPVLTNPVDVVNCTGLVVSNSKSTLKSEGDPKFVHCPGYALVLNGFRKGLTAPVNDAALA